jgi:glycosyltransferase involved in cell wall biosynthesis
MIDSLDVGGAEIVAINLANMISHSPGYISYLCVTRQNGFLFSKIDPKVEVLILDRKRSIDIKAVYKLIAFVKDKQIQLIHAHNTALFLSVLIKMLCPSVKILWHVHSGALAREDKKSRTYRRALRLTSGVISVNRELLSWVNSLGMNKQTWYIPNFVQEISADSGNFKLPGVDGFRVINVSNLRPEKGQIHLIRAFRKVVNIFPQTILFIVGEASNSKILEELKEEVRQLDLRENIQFLGFQENVFSLLKRCDVGVLSSLSEGFPLSLLEYGIAGLPVVATRVGEIPFIVEDNSTGFLVNPGDEDQLTHALRKLLDDDTLRTKFGRLFHDHVVHSYSAESTMEKLLSIYSQILGFSSVR